MQFGRTALRGIVLALCAAGALVLGMGSASASTVTPAPQTAAISSGYSGDCWHYCDDRYHHRGHWHHHGDRWHYCDDWDHHHYHDWRCQEYCWHW